MPQFRKKPVVISAEQFLGKPMEGVAWETRSDAEGHFQVPYVTTAHGQRAYLAHGDWVIPEPTPGQFYPCKPDIFATTYDAVEG